MFKNLHHIHILHGLGLFNKDSLREQWEGLHPNLKQHVEQLINNIKIRKHQTISHKKAIEIIRNS
jgi:hypothetical protein